MLQPSAPLIKYMLPPLKPPEIEIIERRVEHEITDLQQDVTAHSTSPVRCLNPWCYISFQILVNIIEMIAHYALQWNLFSKK